MFNFSKNKNNIKINILAGNYKLKIKSNLIFDKISKEFLSDLSNLLFNDKEARQFPDIISFAFWTRKSNIKLIEKKILDEKLRVGLGLVFHITPSNVPINFCYSFVFGLLTGNSNIIKVPSIEFPQVHIICRKIKNLFNLKKYKKLKERNLFVRYSSDLEEITKIFSKDADGRVIWGGDNSIKNIKKFNSKINTTDIVFKDKYSFCILDAKKILSLKNKDLNKLLNLFYNDTYTLDQNACSSPHLIIWRGNKLLSKKAKSFFWGKFNLIVEKRYNLEKTNSVDKYIKFCSNAIDLKYLGKYNSFKNLINRLELKKLPNDISSLRGIFGYFYEYSCNNLKNFQKIINPKIQTITYFGLNKIELENLIIKNNVLGVDRIIPVGKALDMGFTWDGYNIEKKLSRVIEII